jgi:hypothetical protein
LGEQIFPLSRKTISYFNSCHYTDTVTEQEMSWGKFTIEWAALGGQIAQSEGGLPRQVATGKG